MTYINDTENFRHECWAGYSSILEREGFTVVHTFPDSVRVNGMREVGGKLYVTTSDGAYVYDGEAMKKIETPSRITPLHVMDYDRTWLVDRELSGVNQDMVLSRHDQARAEVAALVEALAELVKKVGCGTALDCRICGKARAALANFDVTP